MIDFKNLYLNTVYIGYVVLLIAAVCAAVKFKNLRAEEKWYAYYLFFVAFIEGTVEILVMIFDFKNTMFTYPWYIFGSYIILMRLYCMKLSVPWKWQLALMIPALAYFIIHYFVPAIDHDLVKVFSNFIVLFPVGICLLQEISKKETGNRFIVSDVSIFMYYVVSLFFFAMGTHYPDMSKQEYFLIWTIHNILLIILYLTFVYILLKLNTTSHNSVTAKNKRKKL